ncbi:hypothetical protein [Syntrophomonas erecta]
MRIYHSEPLHRRKNKIKIPLRKEDIMDENVYEDVWLPLDNKEEDITHLIQQNRLHS